MKRLTVRYFLLLLSGTQVSSQLLQVSLCVWLVWVDLLFNFALWLVSQAAVPLIHGSLYVADNTLTISWLYISTSAVWFCWSRAKYAMLQIGLPDIKRSGQKRFIDFFIDCFSERVYGSALPPPTGKTYNISMVKLHNTSTSCSDKVTIVSCQSHALKYSRHVMPPLQYRNSKSHLGY